ncbi:hypothetical protein [Nocardia transvalensis]|uniref:hypothetical protein n=1 Tax=Nocardia transvalensis TaxID=37333 RepID=UPI001892EDBF|nr:hypothetical protein [Nocardia transvalensis]MBF6334116.1 hypothetical protein [Nocardia transvalensis]
MNREHRPSPGLFSHRTEPEDSAAPTSDPVPPPTFSSADADRPVTPQDAPGRDG